MSDVSNMRYSEWDMWDVLPKGSPYRELVLDDEGDNSSEILLAVASMDMEALIVNAAVAAGVRWEGGRRARRMLIVWSAL